MNLPKKPASLDSLIKSLNKAWRQYNVVSVGAAYGLSSKDTEPCWRIHAYSHDPDNVGRLLPVNIESDSVRYPVDVKPVYPVDVKPVSSAMDVDEN